MKKYSYTLIIALLGLTFVACEDVEDNAIPHIASPVLVEIETLGRYTPLDQVTLMTKISDLDKTNILTEVEGIDTIPAALASVQVLKDINGNAETFFSPLSLTEGAGTIVADWSDILPADVQPEDGATIEFEYFETYEDTPFRKIYRLDYSTTAFEGELPVRIAIVDGEEVEIPITADNQTYTFSYDLISVDKAGVEITIEQQVNDGDFVVLTPPAGGWPVSGTVPLVGTSFESGNTVTLRVIGTKSNLASSELFTFEVQ